MSKKKLVRRLLTLLLCTALICSVSATAFASADGIDQDLSVTESTEPEEATAAATEPDVTQEAAPFAESLEESGSVYACEVVYDSQTNKQFITIQTKSGSTFYIIIDYDVSVNEEEEQYQTYFLNMVDERDLLALMDEETVAELTTCICDTHCEAGAVNVDCPVCKTDMGACSGVTPEPETPATEAAEQPTTAPALGSIALAAGLLAVAGAAGAVYYYIRFIRGKKSQDEDLDFDDDEGYEEDLYINEDEPGITEEPLE